MNYQKIYDDICKRGQERILPKEVYTEKHHIIPKCMEGTNEKSNLTVLTAREHFLVHYILTRIYPNNSKIWNACFKMCVTSGNQRRFIPDSKLYEEIRTNWNKLNRGENHFAFNRPKTEIHKKRIGDSQRGKIISQESIEKRKITLINNPKPCTDERREKYRQFFTQNNPNSRKCQIDDVVYISLSHALKDLDLSIRILRKRLESDLEEWSKWVYLEESKVNQVTREKLSKSKSGFKHSEHSKSNMGQRGELNHFYGKTHTDEAIYKIVLNKPNRKPCAINGIEYMSAVAASRQLNISTSQITRRIQSNKDEWKDWIFINKTEENNL